MKKWTGLFPTSPTTKLNIWSCNMGGGILGYVDLPGGAAATDGVVIDDDTLSEEQVLWLLRLIKRKHS